LLRESHPRRDRRRGVPPPDNGTLRNLFDEPDSMVLTRLEYVETARWHRELLFGQVAIRGRPARTQID